VIAGLAVEATGYLPLPLYTVIQKKEQGRARGTVIPGYPNTAETSTWNLFFPDALKHISHKKLVVIDDCVLTGSLLATVRRMLIHEFKFEEDNIRTAVLVYSEPGVAGHTGGEVPDFAAYRSAVSPFYLPWGPPV
jgi:hypoxanthine phosphoribosyltransferase